MKYSLKLQLLTHQVELYKFIFTKFEKFSNWKLNLLNCIPKHLELE
jgi:hypothetical protein